MGTYVLGEPLGGPGIRPQPYSTDPAVNDYDYESIRGFSSSHSIGSVWAQAAWEVYWALVDAHGFDPDLYDAMGGSGNQRMILYAVEGMKNTTCNPTFADMRDGIVQAATEFYDGEDVCRIWDAFAAFGLGLDADDAGPGSNQVTNGFSTPNPVPVTGLSAVESGGDIELNWNEDTLVNIYRAEGDCGSPLQLLEEGHSGTTFTDTTAMPGVPYSYVIRAGSGGCESADSNCASAFACGDLATQVTFWGNGLSILEMIDCL